MSSADLQLLENQLLLSQEESIGKLIKGTDQYNYYYFLRIFNKHGYNLTEEQKKQLATYIDMKTGLSKRIFIRSLLLEYDQLSNETPSEEIEKQQKAIIEKLNQQLFAFSFNTCAPPARVGGSSSQGGLIEQHQYQSKFDDKVLQIENFFEKAYTENGFSKIKQPLYCHFNVQKLASSPLKIVKAFLHNVGQEIVDFPDIPFLFNHLANLKEFKNEFTQAHFRKLSFVQMEEILKLNQKFIENQFFVGEFYLKKFQYNLKDIQYPKLTEGEKQEILQKLKEVYAWTNTLPPKFKSFNDQILFELLQIGIEVNEYDFDLFLVFLKDPKENYDSANEKQRTYIKNNSRSYQNQWHEYHQLNTNRWISTNQIIEKYLQKYFEKNDDIEILEQYLETRFLKRIQAEVKLYQGQALQNIYDYLSSTQIEQMNSSKLVSICSFNKVYFKHGDPVKLYVELKNIPKLNVKIFEFNSENYFISKQQPLDSQINLDGLIAFEETDFSYTYPPIQKVIKEFEFETITKSQRGVFIVEFIGNGISSRAIIKKGRLQLRETITAAGHRFQILDENFELCSGDKTGVWIDKKFHQIDQQRKEILIPFGERDQQFNAILVHENFAEFTQVFIQKETYSLKCAFLIADEQLLMGAQAKAVILTKLYVNGTEVGLNLLEDQKVVVTSTNDAGVPSTIPFDSLKLETDKPVEVQFPITAKLKTIQIKVSGKVKRMHQGDGNKEEQLEQSHIVTFDNWEGQQIFCNQYLKYDEKNGYQICIVGKNGEPKKNLEVTVTFRLLMIDHTFNQFFTTDETGKVYLGQLNNVQYISSNIRSIGDVNVQQKQWQIQSSSSIQYPNKLIVLEGQQIKLPFVGFTTVEKNLTLYETFGTSERATVQSLTNLIKLENQYITFTLEKKGNYELEFIKDRYTIFINVVEGEKWKGSNIIKVKNQLVIDRGVDQVLAIQNVEKTQIENGTKITGQIASKLKPTVYAYATSFVNERFDLQVGQIVQFISKSRTEQIQIDLYSSVFQSNKELSDEQKYVLNRKTQERYIGNTLEKPQFLLKRQQVRETTTEGESLNQGGSYKDTIEQPMEKARQLNKAYGSASSSSRQQQITTFQDFLKYPASLYSNIQVDAQNQFELHIPSNYSTVVLLVFNEQSYQQNLIPLLNEQIDTRNLAHQSTLEKDKFYSIYRNSTRVEKGNPIQVQDLTSTEIKLVDSLDKLFIILKELRKAQGNESDSRDFQKWEFLVKWHQQTAEQKHKLYDEHQCDELNLFIYFKDLAYFETYTESYIKNKIEKSFIDYFLLKDEAVLRDYGSMAKLKDLNALEQSLLVIYFAEILNLPEDAKLIAQYLENINKQTVIDQRIFKKYFDTVLGAKIEADDQQFIQAEVGVCQQAYQQQMAMPMMQQAVAPRRMMVQQAMPSPAMYQQNLMCMNQAPMQRMARAPMACMAMQQNCDLLNDCLEEDSYAFEASSSKLSATRQNYYAEKRSQFIENFKNLEKTKEYCEKHYSTGTQKDNNTHLVSLNGFFVELANHSVTKGLLKEEFLSSKFIFCNNNQTEMIVVLALIGLPFEAPQQEYKQFGGKGVEIITKAPALFFLKEIKEGKAQLRQDILIAQRFFDPQDRYLVSEDDPELQLEKDVKECLINKIYGCQVIITNCSSTMADYQVLVEVPNGSIPVNTAFYTKSYTITCQPYTTQRIEYYFYFPKTGEFTVYPANVSRHGQVVCLAQEGQLSVVEQKSIQNLDAIDDILAKGSKDDILNFLQTKNIFNRSIFRSEDIRYLLKDKEFYLKVIDIYRKRRFSDFESLKFALHHNDKQGLKELFAYSECQRQITQHFKYFKCSLFEVSTIRMLEYYPLVTKRVHKLTSEAKGILNVEFRNQYTEYLTYLVEKSNHTLSDKLGFIYYLLLQERINEAIQVYKTIPDVEAQGEAVLQYDYFTAYLDFYIGYPNFTRARQICEKYLNYPVIHWRNLFYEVVNLLAEYDGDDDENQKLKTETSQKQKQIQQAKKEETLQSTVEGSEINITYSNLATVTLQFYKIDLEILFSRNPFLNQTEEDFAFVLPNQVVTVKLEEQQQPGLTYKKVVSIPDELRKCNLFIQVKGTTKRTSNRYYSTSLNVQVMENYGQIRVSDSSDKYQSKIYVKAYVKEKNGKESFYKDGYTDLRGRFDYASLSSANLSDVQKFSLLITSDEYGSIIKEINAPSQVGKFETEVKLVSKNWTQKAAMEQEKQSNLYEFKKKSKY